MSHLVLPAEAEAGACQTLPRTNPVSRPFTVAGRYSKRGSGGGGGGKLDTMAGKSDKGGATREGEKERGQRIVLSIGGVMPGRAWGRSALACTKNERVVVNTPHTPPHTAA